LGRGFEQWFLRAEGLGRRFYSEGLGRRFYADGLGRRFYADGLGREFNEQALGRECYVLQMVWAENSFHTHICIDGDVC
jgi:hypothetical protein